jgi:hypothetical protein
MMLQEQLGNRNSRECWRRRRKRRRRVTSCE